MTKLRTPRLSTGPKPRPEKAEQALTVQLLRSIGAHVYPIGTTRRKGDYQGTMMAVGIPDVFAFLPAREAVIGQSEMLRGITIAPAKPPQALWIEQKRHGGRVRPEQKLFAQRCQEAGVAHVTGTCDDVIAYLVQGGWLKASSLPHYRQPKEAT